MTPIQGIVEGSDGQSFEKPQDYYTGVRADLISLVPGIAGRVLEIGCAEGMTLHYLKTHFGCEVIGIDYCATALEKARTKGFEVHACDLNNQKLPFGTEEFDYIIIGDVLEHVYDPWSVLIDVARTLKHDGTILISIPNVKHYSLLKDLILRDKWDYCESGLLDITHIRFFTLHGIKKLLAGSGLEIRSLHYKMVQSRLMGFINLLCFNRLHSFLVFQYLVAAKKHTCGR